ncbi:unnamed protein product, partial [Mesorhabditis belari]|uniref:RING-type domain-containing protein n=1 Tax=Mesorhabditis belari TaxID=2138241 RepID=A0AAF3ERJ8_9BILA
MGNCLPVFGGRSRSDEIPIERRSSGSSQHGFDNPVALPHSSAYVNQLYNENMLRSQRVAEEQAKGADTARRRVQGLLEQIPADMFTQDMKDAECAICMVDFEPGDCIRYLPCMHCFHQQCVDDWLLRSFTCPSCLAPVDSTLLSSLTAHTSLSLSDLASSPATVTLNAIPVNTTKVNGFSH